MKEHTLKLMEAIEKCGVEVDGHLDREDLVPVLTGLQVQGDVIFLPTRVSKKPGRAVPPEGVPVVRGENGGNTHMLLADGAVLWSPVSVEGQDLGVLTVADGATGFMAHPEHGYLAFGPGAYIARRQREQADEIRLVQD